MGFQPLEAPLVANETPTSAVPSAFLRPSALEWEPETKEGMNGVSGAGGGSNQHRCAWHGQLDPARGPWDSPWARGCPGCL